MRWNADMGDTGSVGFNMGARFRYDDIWSANHYFNEPVNFWDMNRDPNLRRVPDQAYRNDGNPWVEGKDARGVLSKWYIGGSESSPTGGDTEMKTAGPFAQADLQFTDTFSLLAGFTVDFLMLLKFTRPWDSMGPLITTVTKPLRGATGCRIARS